MGEMWFEMKDLLNYSPCVSWVWLKKLMMLEAVNTSRENKFGNGLRNNAQMFW